MKTLVVVKMSGNACPVLLAGKKPNKPKEVFYAYRVDDFAMDRRVEFILQE